MKSEVKHSGDCSIWISPICDCGELRKVISNGDVIKTDEIYEQWFLHLNAIDKQRNDGFNG